MADTDFHQNLPASSSVVLPASAALREETMGRMLALGILLLSVLTGLILAIMWSFQVADGVLGQTIANTALGTTAANLRISDGGPWLGIAFSFIAGLAATFTACNCVVFSCIAPLAAEKSQKQQSMWRVIGLMALGIVLVTATYGVAGAVFGHAIPILSEAKLAIGSGFPVRLAQSTVVFAILGAILVLWGAHTLGLIPNLLGTIAVNRPWIKPFALGLMIGCFTVGRPFPLFRKAFEYAANTGNPLFSASALALQGLGNIMVMVLLLLLLIYGTGGRFERWLINNPRRIVLVTAISMIVGGTFFLAYWGLRVPSYYGIGWFPQMPYK